LAQVHGLRVEVRPAFEELHFGDWTGKTLTELASVPDWTAFNAFRSAGQPPNGERMITVQDRVVGEMLKLRTEFPIIFSVRHSICFIASRSASDPSAW
jgi:broad specificity phosphatase PhoE